MAPTWPRGYEVRARWSRGLRACLDVRDVTVTGSDIQAIERVARCLDAARLAALARIDATGVGDQSGASSVGAWLARATRADVAATSQNGASFFGDAHEPAPTCRPASDYTTGGQVDGKAMGTDWAHAYGLALHFTARAPADRPPPTRWPPPS